MYTGLHVKYPLLSDFHENLIFSQILEKYSYIKFHEDPSTGGRVVPCRQKERWTDMTKLTVTFRKFFEQV